MNSLTRAIVNKVRKNYSDTGVLPQQPGESIHLPQTNYCGPGTKLLSRHGPVSGKYQLLDSICMKHDYQYNLASKEPDATKRAQLITKADQEMVDKINSLPSEDRTFLDRIAKLMITGKITAENLLGKNLYGGRAMGVPDVVTVSRVKKPTKKVAVDLDALVKTDKDPVEIKQILLAKISPDLQKGVFFKDIIKEVESKNGNLSLALSNMTDENIVRYVTDRLRSQTQDFYDNVIKKKKLLEARKTKILNSTAYRIAPLAEKKAIVEQLNTQIRGMKQLIQSLEANIEIIDEKGVPISEVVFRETNRDQDLELNTELALARQIIAKVNNRTGHPSVSKSYYAEHYLTDTLKRLFRKYAPAGVFQGQWLNAPLMKIAELQAAVTNRLRAYRDGNTLVVATPETMALDETPEFNLTKEEEDAVIGSGKKYLKKNNKKKNMKTMSAN